MGLAIIIIGALVLAAGVGVKVKTKWGESQREDSNEGISWAAVAAGILTMAVGVVIMHPWSKDASTKEPAANASSQPSATASSPQPSPSVAGQTTTTSGASASSPASQESSSALFTPSPTVKPFDGDVPLSYINLDKNPPEVLTANNNATLWTPEGARPDDTTLYGYSLYNNSLAIWTGPGQPSAKACADAITTLGLTETKITGGTALCVKTRADHYAFLTVGKYDSNRGAYMGHVTVFPDAS